MQEHNFELERGNINELSGNVFVYWMVSTNQEEEEEKEKVNKIVVTNFIVSPLQFEKNTIAATFPPIVFEHREEVLALADKANIDVIRMDSVDIPEEGFNFNTFFKKQLGQFNKVVSDYSRIYADNLSSAMEGAAPEKASEKENLEHIRELVRDTREAYRLHRNKKLATDMIIQLRRISHVINSPTPKYDIENLIGLLDNPDERVDEVSALYFQKFFAIYTEQYEEAEKLKQEIENIKTRLSGKPATGHPPLDFNEDS